MLKKCSVLLVIAAVATCLQTFAQESRGKILYLHLHRDAAGISLLRSTARPGKLKPEVQTGPLRFEVTRADGSVLYRGGVGDPLLERIEYADANDPVILRSETVVHDSAEFTIRLPGEAAGETLRLFRRREAPLGHAGMASGHELIAEILVPKEVPRLEALAAGAKMFTLLTNGPTSSRLNIAILAEGFTAAQESFFTNRAQSVLTQFLAASPYNEYRNHFNAFGIFVASAEAGSDHPESNTYRNTYFNSSYGTGSLVRLITIPPNQWNSSYSAGRGKVFALLEQFLPEYDIALLLVNDSEYGGSGGVPAIASINVASAELALHEIAHSFAGLGDEYESPYPGYPDNEEPNTTRETRRDFIKWRDWIDPATPIPTPGIALYGNVVGLFEGAHFHSSGWFRPKLDCRMRTLGQEFCEVCKEAIVLSAYSRLEIIHGSSPSENNITVPGGGEILLQVDTVSLAQSSLAYSWIIDGVTNQLFSSNTFSASYATLGIGTRLVRATVADPTSLVRTDRDARLWKSRSWLVTVVSATNQPPVLSQITDRTTVEGTPLSINFTVADPDTPIQFVVLAAKSSDTNVVGVSDIQLSGSGTNRTLTILPECGRLGLTVITVGASDGANVTETSFAVTVEARHNLITISPIPDQKSFSGPIRVPFSYDIDACHQEVFWIIDSNNDLLLPVSNITVEGEGTNRTLRLDPVAGETGETLVSVSASNGNAVARMSFTVTVLQPPTATALAPQITPDGLLLRFTCEPAAAMVLEFSTDLRMWTPVISSPNATTIEHTVPKQTFGTSGFYRLRLVPL